MVRTADTARTGGTKGEVSWRFMAVALGAAVGANAHEEMVLSNRTRREGGSTGSAAVVLCDITRRRHRRQAKVAAARNDKTNVCCARMLLSAFHFELNVPASFANFFYDVDVFVDLQSVLTEKNNYTSRRALKSHRRDTRRHVKAHFLTHFDNKVR